MEDKTLNISIAITLGLLLVVCIFIASVKFNNNIEKSMATVSNNATVENNTLENTTSVNTTKFENTEANKTQDFNITFEQTEIKVNQSNQS